VDDLDEDDAELLASVAAGSPTDQIPTDYDDLIPSEPARLLTAAQVDALRQATNSDIWPEQAQIMLREWLDRLDKSPRRFAMLTLVLVARPPQELRKQIVSALALWHEAPADMEVERARRERVVADALGSVRAEGLEPSAAALRDSTEYEAGRMTAEDLYQSALRRAHAR
jgi:hypothetical protein